MNDKNKRFLTSRLMATTLLTTMLLISGGASAKEHKLKTANNHAGVVSHISFTGFAVVDMAIQRQGNDKYYLYVQHSKEQGISIIDISKPARPRAIGVIPWPDPAVPSRMNVTGDLAIIAENEAHPAHNSASNDDLVLWDLSKPGAPRVMQKFSGVVKWLEDERDFVYVLNGDGLWVVSKPADRQLDQAASSNSYGG
jgi:hypothetical protein